MQLTPLLVQLAWRALCNGVGEAAEAQVSETAFGTVSPRAEHHFSVGLENRILLLALPSHLLWSTTDHESLLVRDQ